MNQSYEASFDEQMGRIRLITGKRTQIELANFFGIRQSLVSDAKRRGKIPSNWLVILLRTKNVNPEWLLSGKGPCFMPLPPLEGGYESGDDYAIKKADGDALRRLPSRILADELVRRIAVSQETVFCSEGVNGTFDEENQKK